MVTGLDTTNPGGTTQATCSAGAIQPGGTTQATCSADAIQPGGAPMSSCKVLDANAIKFIAIVAMTIDHVAWTVYPGYPHRWTPILMHIVGRITMPIMCYFVAEGFFHTRNIGKYTFRMFLFAVISHFAFMFQWYGFDWHAYIPFYYGAQGGSQTSVIWTLAWGLVMLRVEYSERIRSRALKTLLICLICLASFCGDWSCTASLLVLSFGTNRGHPVRQTLWLVFYVTVFAYTFVADDMLYATMQLAVVLAIPILAFYNGRRGPNPRVNAFMKWFFYVYYPLHLTVLGLLKVYHLIPISQ